jgi:MFS family permease
MPETLRALVGNGSIPPSKHHKALVPWIKLPIDPTKSPTKHHPHVPNPLRLLTHPTVILVLFINGLFNAIFFTLAVTISTEFQGKYPFLDQTKLGLCFLPVGLGFGFGSVVTGKLVDKDYVRLMSKWKRDGKDKHDFPIEYARLRTTPIYLTLSILSTIGFGWSGEKAVNLSVPLILTFICMFEKKFHCNACSWWNLAGWSCLAMMNIHQTLLMDLFPSQGSSVTAIVREFRVPIAAF